MLDKLKLTIQYKKDNILVDCGPDIRHQLLKNPIGKLDALIVTHEHADHTHGIDDLRVFTFRSEKEIPLYASNKTCEDLKKRFSYIFEQKKVFGALGQRFGAPIAKIGLKPIPSNQSITVNGLELSFESLPHGHTSSLAIIHSKFAYLIDCAEVPEALIQRLKELELDLLILDCARRKPVSTHLHLEKSIEIAKKIAPKKLRLTHLSHDFEHDELEKELESLHFEAKPTYDGENFELIF